MREEILKAKNFLRRLEDKEPQEPVPPTLPEARIVNVEGRGEMFCRIGPAVEGQPTIVLLHGWTLSSDLNWFSGGYETAARHGRVIAPDIRGHGRGLRSEKPFTLEAAVDDVIALVRQLDAAPAIFVGYSMGGSIALACAARHPEVTAGVVVASCAVQWRANLRDRIAWLGLGFAEYVLRLGAPEGITDRYLRSAVERSPDLEPYLGWVKAEARRGDPSDIGHAAKALAHFDAADLVPQIDAPCAVVVTKGDYLIPRRRQEALAEALGCSTIPVDGRHNSWLVIPDQWNAALDEAIGKVIANRAA